MTRRLGLHGSLATVLALLLAIAAMGPAAAAKAPTRAWSAEKFAMSLLNCTRTGGWVTNAGKCMDRDSGKHSAYQAPLRRHPGISKKVAWPWAKAMVVNNVCGHVIPGKPKLGQRMRNKGFKHPTIGENVGCGWSRGAPRDIVLKTHLAYQKEKATNGGHWQNLKSASYKSVGVGVATRNGRTMVVFDFYGKKY